VSRRLSPSPSPSPRGRGSRRRSLLRRAASDGGLLRMDPPDSGLPAPVRTPASIRGRSVGRWCWY
jgi:hypothetical protein